MHGALCTVPCTRCLVHGALYTVPCTRCLVHGALRMVSTSFLGQFFCHLSLHSVVWFKLPVFVISLQFAVHFGAILHGGLRTVSKSF